MLSSNDLHDAYLIQIQTVESIGKEGFQTSQTHLFLIYVLKKDLSLINEG